MDIERHLNQFAGAFPAVQRPSFEGTARVVFVCVTYILWGAYYRMDVILVTGADHYCSDSERGSWCRSAFLRQSGWLRHCRTTLPFVNLCWRGGSWVRLSDVYAGTDCVLYHLDHRDVRNVHEVCSSDNGVTAGPPTSDVKTIVGLIYKRSALLPVGNGAGV